MALSHLVGGEDRRYLKREQPKVMWRLCRSLNTFMPGFPDKLYFPRQTVSSFENFHYNHVALDVEKFVNAHLSSFYYHITKDR